MTTQHESNPITAESHLTQPICFMMFQTRIRSRH